MTRGEAISWLHGLKVFFSMRDINEALDTAISSLRGTTREQVEKALKGEWVEDEFSISRCDQCGYEQEEAELITPFCPNCGAPMTDEAVDLLAKRLEEVLNA